MNKFELMNVVNISTLRPEDKNLLNELILRADEHGECFPSVERLCQVRGIKHEKNFKGVETYLPGLVSKEKHGRKNYYYLDIDKIMTLSANEVIIKHTPAVEGVYTPAVADNTPAVADNTPAVEGANSSIDNTVDNSKDNSEPPVAGAPVVSPNSQDNDYSSSLLDIEEPLGAPRDSYSSSGVDTEPPGTGGIECFPDLGTGSADLDDVSEYNHTPAVEGVSEKETKMKPETRKKILADAGYEPGRKKEQHRTSVLPPERQKLMEESMAGARAQRDERERRENERKNETSTSTPKDNSKPAEKGFAWTRTGCSKPGCELFCWCPEEVKK